MVQAVNLIWDLLYLNKRFFHSLTTGVKRDRALLTPVLSFQEGRSRWGWELAFERSGPVTT
jgi:hypothetical protein